MTLQLEITDATQYATLYRDGAPIATLNRRRVIDKTGPVWKAFNTKGVLVREFRIANIPAERMAAITARAVDREEERARRAAEFAELHGKLNLLIETPIHSFEVECAADVDIEGEFEALCLETGEWLTIYGWQCDITDLTGVDCGMSDEAERAYERRALGGEC